MTSGLSPEYQSEQYGASFESISDKYALPEDLSNTIEKFVVLRHDDVPTARWTRTGRNPLPLGLFRSSYLDPENLAALQIDTQLSGAMPGFAVEVSMNVSNSTRDVKDGVIYDIGNCGLAYVEGLLTLWARAEKGITKIEAKTSKAVPHHYLSIFDQKMRNMSLYVDGKKVGSAPLHGQLEFGNEESTVSLTRSSSEALYVSCPWKAHREMGIVGEYGDDSCNDCDRKQSIGVLPTKGTLGIAKVYDFPLDDVQAYVCYLASEKLTVYRPPNPF